MPHFSNTSKGSMTRPPRRTMTFSKIFWDAATPARFKIGTYDASFGEFLDGLPQALRASGSTPGVLRSEGSAK